MPRLRILGNTRFSCAWPPMTERCSRRAKKPNS